MDDALILQEGTVPRTQVKLSGGDVLTVDSLGGVVQLNALRAFLADGFQAHLQARNEICLLPANMPPAKDASDLGLSAMC